MFTKFLQRRRDNHDLLFSKVILPSFALRPFFGLFTEKPSALGFLLEIYDLSSNCFDFGLCSKNL